MGFFSREFAAAIVLIASLFLTLCTPEGYASVELSAELKGLPCAQEALSVVKAWQGQEPWTRALASRPGESVYRAPTQTLGKWIELSRDASEIKLKLFSGTQILQFSLGAECRGEARLVARKAKDRFGKARSFYGFKIMRDPELAALLGEQKPGILFLWTPHKPISISGLEQILAAAKELKIPVYPVVEPNSAPSAVTRELKRLKIAKANVYYLDSFDLQYRGFRLHFPSLIVFNQGRFTSQVRRGYEDAYVYVDYLRGHL